MYVVTWWFEDGRKAQQATGTHTMAYVLVRQAQALGARTKVNWKPHKEADRYVQEEAINRRTGAHVQLLDTAHPKADLDPCGGRYVTVCWTHGRTVNHERRRTAFAFFSQPWQWCETCLDIYSGRKEKPEVVRVDIYVGWTNANGDDSRAYAALWKAKGSPDDVLAARRHAEEEHGERGVVMHFPVGMRIREAKAQVRAAALKAAEPPPIIPTRWG